MKDNFQDCLARVLKDEGGYSNDPSDSGGATKYGITIADVRKYVKKNATPADVKALTLDQASSIYKSKYWDALDCDSLPSGVDYTCFDYGVNSGLGRPRAALQRFKSLTGVKLIDAINDERTSFLRSISGGKNSKFLRGWLARVARVRVYSKSLVKTDKTSGPSAAIVAGLPVWVVVSNYIHDHPYLVLAGSAVVATIVGTLIHIYMNRNNG